MRHRASAKFWRYYHELPEAVQKLADKSYELIKADPQHGSVQLKKVGRYWSARIGTHFRAVAVQEGDDLVWFWIGRHDEYELVIRASRR